MFVLKDITGILLDSIKIYGVKKNLQLGNVITQETDFYIRTINNKIGIYPMTPCDLYYLMVERVVDAKKITIESSDYVNKTVFDGNYNFTTKDEGRILRMTTNHNDPLYQKVDLNVFAVKTSNSKNCKECTKSSVCKYQEVVIKEVERLVGELEKKELPLSVNINCNEFLQKQTVGVR